MSSTANQRLRSAALALLAAVAFGLAAPAPTVAQATPYVPNLDPAYGDIDALVAAGWVTTAIAAPRPYSRLQFARLTVEARERAGRFPRQQASAIRAGRLEAALARLEHAFAGEIRSLCANGGAPCPAATNGMRVRSASLDVSWADSPDRAVPTSYDPPGASYIDARLNPLLQKNEGRVLANGATLGTEAVIDIALGRFAAAQVQPRAWIDASRGADHVRLTGALQSGYVRALARNVALDVGRQHVTGGYGRDAGPIISHNARGLDMVRLSLDRPVTMPWVLRVLGPLSASVLVADMGGGSDTPHSKLAVGSVDIHPRSSLELGATLLNHFGDGPGIPRVSLRQRLADLFLIYPQGAAVSDKVFGARARLTVPSVRAQFYADMMTTDDHHLLKYASQALVTEAVWTGGATFTGLGQQRRADLWLEARRSGVRPYTHHQFTSGLTVDGRIIGDAIGPLGSGVTLGTEWHGVRHRMSASATWERYSGADHYEATQGSDIVWIRATDSPDENRVRLLLDWSPATWQRGFVPSVRFGYEGIRRWAFTGASRSNVLAQIRVDYRR